MKIVAAGMSSASALAEKSWTFMAHSLSTAIHVNGTLHVVDAAPETPLLYILRNDLALNGPKFGCGLGECGACAILIGDRAVRSCLVPLRAVGPRAITTLEGLGTPDALHPVQAAFIAEAAAQCGYCLNGMIIGVTALLRRTPNPADADIRIALQHNLCRCGTHIEILRAARTAATLIAASPIAGPEAVVPPLEAAV